MPCATYVCDIQRSYCRISLSFFFPGIGYLTPQALLHGPLSKGLLSTIMAYMVLRSPIVPESTTHFAVGF